MIDGSHPVSQQGQRPMARNWIQEGLQHTRDRAEQVRLAAERRTHQASVIKEKGPAVMRAVVTEVRAVVDEYKRAAQAAESDVEFEELPHEGFCVTRTTPPRVELQCRPSYETQAVYCNVSRSNDPPGEPVERVFSLEFAVHESERVVLREGARVFHTAADTVEFLVKPVLFPPPEEQLRG
jgi:hypothetical protein